MYRIVVCNVPVCYKANRDRNQFGAWLDIDTISEPVTSKMYTLAYVPIEDSDQPAFLRSLTRVFDGHFMGSQ